MRASTRDWKQELTARLEALDAQAATTSELAPEMAIRRSILRSELTGEKADLTPHLSRTGEAEPTDTAVLETLKATNAALETELAALKAERLTSEPAFRTARRADQSRARTRTEVAGSAVHARQPRDAELHPVARIGKPGSASEPGRNGEERCLTRSTRRPRTAY